MEEGFYWKEIIGTLIWIALLVWLFQLDGLERCQQWWEQFKEEKTKPYTSWHPSNALPSIQPFEKTGGLLVRK